MKQYKGWIHQLEKWVETQTVYSYKKYKWLINFDSYQRNAS